MNKDNKNDFSEDFLIKKAALSLVEKDNALFDSLEKDDTIVNPNQDELDKKVYSMIEEHLGKKSKKLYKKNKLKKLMLKIAVFILILTSGFIIPFFTVDAFREKVLNFYIENFNTHTTFTPNEDIYSYVNLENITYLPEGFNLTDEYKTQSSITYIFNNSINKMINITFYEHDTSFSVDTENSEMFSLSINNENAYIYRKEGLVTLIFKYHGNPIIIYSNSDATITNEELIKIAESII